jgi:poly(3-hydroxybutyrate) depolymerase
MHYYAYEFAHTVLSPWRLGVSGLRSMLDWPLNPVANTPYGRHLAAACELFENVTRRYGKPEFGLRATHVAGVQVGVREQIVASTPFCNLIHFKRDETALTGKRYDPKVLVVAPMSGHYATLLRGTVKAMLPDHEVYITDWVDARDIPLAMGRFDLDDFIDHVIEFIRVLGPDTHVMGVCQPAVPVLAAVAHMASMDDPCQPASMILMGGPIDTQRNPTGVNQLAETRSIEWFESNVISTVPFPHAGFMRPVYPGFMQLTGFMTMNLERHMNAHVDLFNNLVKGDCDSVKQHQDFYEEYLAVMDLTAEFYLQTVKTVFQDHALPRGKMMHRGVRVDCSAIQDTALMTVEGERDDVCGRGQTEAAHDLCTNIPEDQKVHYLQEGVGHYGIFNGTRWRTEIQPRIREFIRTIEYERGDLPTGRTARRMHHPAVAVSPV